MVSFKRATSTIASSGFLMSVGLVVTGVLGAQMVTSIVRNNVYDLQMTGGDAVYAFGGAVVTLAVLPRQYANPLALGMASSGAITVAQDLGLVEN